MEPSIAQMLRKASDLDHVRGTLKDLKLSEKDYIFPVSDNNRTDREGGSHWSLLMYSLDEKQGGFHHHSLNVGNY